MTKRAVRIGLFGGSFDPVHNGHLKLAREARRELKLDRVIFIPARIPPHKTGKKLSGPGHRTAMLKAALKNHPRFEIDPFELTRKRTTYTYQTVRHFRDLCPDAELYFIAGSDSLRDLGTWKKPDELLSLARMVVGRRPGVRLSTALPYAGRVRVLARPIAPVSSSEIRARVRAGRSLRGLVPAAVERYIRRHHLYA